MVSRRRDVKNCLESYEIVIAYVRSRSRAESREGIDGEGIYRKNTMEGWLWSGRLK